MCWIWHPPQVPKTRQNGWTRSGDPLRRRTISPTAYFGLTDTILTRARSFGSGPKQKTTNPLVRPTAWPLASRSVNATSTSAPTRSEAVALRGMPLFVKRLEQLIRLVDEELDALAGRVGRTTAGEQT